VARVVEDHVKSWFVDAVLFGDLAHGGAATLDVAGDGVAVTVKKRRKKAGV
jgi:hypothetical protein